MALVQAAEGMTDLVVIHPNSGDEVYQQLNNELTAVEPPMWTRLIAGYALKHGFSVEIIDAEAENLSADAVAQRAHAAHPLLVAVVVFGHQPSASTQMMPGARKICRALSEHSKSSVSTPVIAIGGHISALPEDSLRYLECTFACKGEGPVTVVALMRALKDFDGITWTVPFSQIAALTNLEIPGLVWRYDNTIVVNKEAPLIDTADLDGDVWHMLPMELYRSHNWQCFGDLDKRQPYASIYTSLSCPFNCSFCCIAAPFGAAGTGYRLRDPKAVVEEVNRLYTIYGVRTFKIIDEMFVLNAKHVSAICDGIIALGYAHELNFWAYARVDTIKPAMLEKMRAAGIRWLALGIESGSEDVRDTARKSITSDKIESIVEQIKLTDINVIGNYIFGLPGETQDSMRKTLDLAKTLNCEFANFYCLPPGSLIYTQNGQVKIEDVKQGDAVLGETGIVHVKNTMQREYSGSLYAIKPRYLPSVSVTDEHPIRVVSISRLRDNTSVIGEKEWKLPGELVPYVSHFEKHDALVIPKAPLKGADRTFVDFSKYVAGHLGDGRRGGQLNPRGKAYLQPWLVTPEMAELFGWYVAEGSLMSRKNDQLGFSLGAHEPDNIKRVRDLVATVFGLKTRALPYKACNVVRVQFTSKVMLRAFPDIMGTDCYTKHIPDFIMNGSTEIAQAFLNGYIAGDGTSWPGKNNQHAVSTASETLARQLILLFLKIGIVPGYREEAPKEAQFPERICMRNRNYFLYWTVGNGSKINGSKHWYADAEAFYIPIKSIDVADYMGTVHNIETSDNTYAVPFIVHNCSMPYPGSKLYADAVTHAVDLPREWAGYSQHSFDCKPLATEALSARAILGFRDDAFLDYFRYEPYLEMVENKFGYETRGHIERMTAHRLDRAMLRPVFVFMDREHKSVYAASVDVLLINAALGGLQFRDAKIFYYSDEASIDGVIDALRSRMCLNDTSTFLVRRPAKYVRDDVYFAVYPDERPKALQG
jgi:anaerobic magnesium-protoporphyrin IX monomethyl ester cyclase